MPIKRVKVQELELGMFIHDLQCSYLQHGFLFQQFLIKKPEQIQKMARIGLAEVLIDTDRGSDVRVVAPGVAPAAAPRESPAAQPSRVSQKQEAAVARKVMGEAQDVVHDLLRNVRLGKQVDPAKAGAVVEKINESVLRNPGAMLSRHSNLQHRKYAIFDLLGTCGGAADENAGMRLSVALQFPFPIAWI